MTLTFHAKIYPIKKKSQQPFFLTYKNKIVTFFLHLLIFKVMVHLIISAAILFTSIIPRFLSLSSLALFFLVSRSFQCVFVFMFTESIYLCIVCNNRMKEERLKVHMCISQQDMRCAKIKKDRSSLWVELRCVFYF